MQLPVNDFKAAGGLFLHFRSRMRQVFFQQLHVDVERTERIANLVGETRQQARQEEPLLLRRQLCHIFAQRFGQNSFHGIRLDARGWKGEPRLGLLTREVPLIMHEKRWPPLLWIQEIQLELMKELAERKG